VSVTTVVGWENQRKWVGQDKVADLAKVLGIAEHDLFRGEDRPLPPPPPTTAQTLIRFGRLLASADPARVQDALELLEIGQPDHAESVARKRTSRT
jgi:hypothetical protein